MVLGFLGSFHFLFKNVVDVGNVFVNLFNCFNTVVGCQQFDRVLVQGLVLIGHDPQHEELLHDFRRLAVEDLTQVLGIHANFIFKAFWQWPFLSLGRLLLRLRALLMLLVLLLAALGPV